MSYQVMESHRCFEGTQSVYSHWSETTKSEMRFALFTPPMKKKDKVPVLFWLSGLTCSEQNFITKTGAQAMAAKLGLAIVVPDTSPRAIEAPHEDYLGEGASFYLDALEDPWQKHYQIYTYLSQELPEFIANHFPLDKERYGISGHSMGGHGALVIGLRNPQVFQSLSAFAPISSLTQSPWGIHALTNYLGEDKTVWERYDACSVIINNPWPHGKILIDQGTADPFVENQLKPQLLIDAAKRSNTLLNFRFQEGYDHSYYFVSTFINDHLQFHQGNWA